MDVGTAKVGWLLTRYIAYPPVVEKVSKRVEMLFLSKWVGVTYMARTPRYILAFWDSRTTCFIEMGEGEFAVAST